MCHHIRNKTSEFIEHYIFFLKMRCLIVLLIIACVASCKQTTMPAQRPNPFGDVDTLTTLLKSDSVRFSNVYFILSNNDTVWVNKPHRQDTIFIHDTIMPELF